MSCNVSFNESGKNSKRHRADKEFKAFFKASFQGLHTCISARKQNTGSQNKPGTYFNDNCHNFHTSVKPDAANAIAKHTLFIKKVLKTADHHSVVKYNEKGANATKNSVDIAAHSHIQIVESDANSTSPFRTSFINCHSIAFSNVV